MFITNKGIADLAALLVEAEFFMVFLNLRRFNDELGIGDFFDAFDCATYAALTYKGKEYRGFCIRKSLEKFRRSRGGEATYECLADMLSSMGHNRLSRVVRDYGENEEQELNM